MGNQLSRCFYFMVRCYKIHPIGFECFSAPFSCTLPGEPRLGKERERLGHRRVATQEDKGCGSGPSRKRASGDSQPFMDWVPQTEGCRFPLAVGHPVVVPGFAIHDSGPPWESRFQRACRDGHC